MRGWPENALAFHILPARCAKEFVPPSALRPGGFNLLAFYVRQWLSHMTLSCLMSHGRPRYHPRKPGPAGLVDIQVSGGLKLVANGGNDVLENGDIELGVQVLDTGGI